MKNGQGTKFSRPLFSFVDFTFKRECWPFIYKPWHSDSECVREDACVCLRSSRSFSFMIIPAQATALTLAMQWFMQRPPVTPMSFCDLCVTLNMQHAHASQSSRPHPHTPGLTPRPRPRPTAQAATHREDHLSLHLCSHWLITGFYGLWLGFIQSLIIYSN